MDAVVRDAIASVMRKFKAFKRLDQVEFETQLEWQLREVRLTSKDRIHWLQFELGRRLLKHICKVQKGRCYYCAALLDSTESKADSAFHPTFEHVVPLSKGGKDHPDNLVVACFNCNQRRS